MFSGKRVSSPSGGGYVRWEGVRREKVRGQGCDGCQG